MRTLSFDLDGRSSRRESNLALLSLWNSIVLFKSKPQILNKVHFIGSFLCGYVVKLHLSVEQLLPRRIVSLQGVLEREAAPLSPFSPLYSPVFLSSPCLSLFIPLLPYFFTLRVLFFSGGLSLCISSSSGALAVEICIPLLL